MLCMSAVCLPLRAAAISLDTDVVKVYLSSMGSVSSVQVTLNGDYLLNEDGVELSAGTYTLSASEGCVCISSGETEYLSSGVTATMTTSSGSMTVSNKSYGSCTYIGAMAVINSGGGLMFVNYCPIEEYTAGVLQCEVGSSWPTESLRAMAVAVRSYAVSFIHNGNTYDLTDTTQHQMFKGYCGSSVFRDAVSAVAGVVLTYNNTVITCYYSTSNGGYIESTENLWGSARGYSVAKEDPFDYRSGSSQYTVSISKENVAAIEILSADSGKRIKSVLVTYPDGSEETISGDTFRKTYGLRNNLVLSITDTGENIIIEGGGYGHAVGMSHAGAQQMGKEGYSWQDILAFYYPNTSVDVLELQGYSFTRPQGSTRSFDDIGHINSSYTKKNVATPTPSVDPDATPVPTEESVVVPETVETVVDEGPWQAVVVNTNMPVALRGSCLGGYSTVGKLFPGESVLVEERNDLWCSVRLDADDENSETAYVYGYYLQFEESGSDLHFTDGEADSAVSTVSTNRKGMVTTDILTLRDVPDGNKVGLLYMGDIVDILAYANDYVKLLIGGSVCYADAVYIKNVDYIYGAKGSVTAVVTASKAFLRASASSAGARLATVTAGTVLNVLYECDSVSGTFYAVSLAEDTAVCGCIDADYISIEGSTDASAVVGLTGTCTVLKVPLYTDASSSAKVYGYLTRGDSVTVLAVVGDYYRIRCEEGTYYVKADYVSVN